MSKPYAEVIGDPIAQSKSPIIHGFWLQKLGLDAAYSRYHVTPDQLETYLAERRQDPNWRGCNVTMPHKQAVMAHLDGVEEQAQIIGAVNTVFRRSDGSLTGMNTDAPGFVEPLKSVLAETHLFRMARILGTGGAARAIIRVLAANGFTLVVAGRNPDKARKLLDELAPNGEHHAVHLEHFAQPTDFEFDDREQICDLVINASPLGMRGQPKLAFDWSHAPPGAIAYDIVTDPLVTPFLNGAKDHGHQTLDGYAMLIGQAVDAFKQFFGAEPPREYDQELRELLVK